jgi:hypothetical protein
LILRISANTFIPRREVSTESLLLMML